MRRLVSSAMLAAYERGAVAREVDLPTPGFSFYALPLSDRDQTAGVLGIAIDDTLAKAATGRSGTEEWLSVGPELRVHRNRPEVLVRRGSTDNEIGSANELGAGAHEDVPNARPEDATTVIHATLSPIEDALLRHLLTHHNDVQPAEALFQVAWPDDPVGRHGLRPEQRDRLRRLVFQLRRQVEPNPSEPRYLCTAHGVGYALYSDAATTGMAGRRDDEQVDGRAAPGRD